MHKNKFQLESAIVSKPDGRKLKVYMMYMISLGRSAAPGVQGFKK